MLTANMMAMMQVKNRKAVSSFSMFIKNSYSIWNAYLLLIGLFSSYFLAIYRIYYSKFNDIDKSLPVPSIVQGMTLPGVRVLKSLL